MHFLHYYVVIQHRYMVHGSIHLFASKSGGLKPWFGCIQSFSTCWSQNSHPAQDIGLPDTFSQLTQLHACLLVVHNQKQINPAFRCVSCLAEGCCCDRVNPSGAANITLCRAKLSPPALGPWPFTRHHHHGARVFVVSPLAWVSL